MPFKKGNNANPKGRGTETEHKRRLACEWLERLIPKAADVFEEMLNEKANKAFAAKEIFDRCFGKAPQSMEVKGTLEQIIVNVLGKHKPNVDGGFES